MTTELDQLDVGVPAIAGEADPLRTPAGVERRVAVLVAGGHEPRDRDGPFR